MGKRGLGCCVPCSSVSKNETELNQTEPHRDRDGVPHMAEAQRPELTVSPGATQRHCSHRSKSTGPEAAAGPAQGKAQVGNSICFLPLTFYG